MIRDSKTIILKIGNRVIKFPYSVSSVKETNSEKQSLEFIKKDRHFSKYLPDYLFFLGIIQIMPRLYDLPMKSTDFNNRITDYFTHAFHDKYTWKEEDAYSTINKSLDRFLVEQDMDLSFWVNILSKILIPISSAHGDFHSGNFLVKNNKLYFIDWIRYQKRSSRFYDLIDFYVFHEKASKETWIESWKKLNNLKIKNIFSIPVKKEYFFAYAIWKTAEELKTLYDRKLLTKSKIKKYLSFLDDLKNLSETYE